MGYACKEMAVTVLELIAVMAVLGTVTMSAMSTFAPSRTLLPLRISALLIQTVILDGIRAAHATEVTQRIHITATTVHRENQGVLPLKHGVSVLNPTVLSLYPSRVVTPYTITLRNTAGRCLVTVSLRGRTRIRCG